MRFHRIITALCAALAIVPQTLKAEPTDSLPMIPTTAEQAHDLALRKSTKELFFNNDGHQAPSDSIRMLMDRFYADQWRHFQDPQAPYFLMMSRDATLAMGIGGAVRMRGYYDFAGVVPSSAFMPYSIPVPRDRVNTKRLGATPSGTALFFHIIGTNKALGNFAAYIQGNFSGYDGKGFKLKKSYVTINDWTVGYNTSTFVDPAATPPVIDAQGPCGTSTGTAVLLRWEHTMRSHWVVAASAEFPSSSVGSDGVTTKSVDDWFPDVAAFGQYQWAQGQGHVRLSGMLRVLPYRDLLTLTNHNKIGWGSHLSAVVPVAYNWKFYGSVLGGAGIGGFVNDMTSDKLDLLNRADAPGSMYAPYTLGYTAGVRYNFLPNLYGSISLSQAHMYERHGSTATSYRSGTFGVMNLFWDMSARLQAGIEALYGRRGDKDDTHASAHRINMMFQFSF